MIFQSLCHTEEALRLVLAILISDPKTFCRDINIVLKIMVTAIFKGLD